jgi:hypothetical protein
MSLNIGGGTGGHACAGGGGGVGRDGGGATPGGTPMRAKIQSQPSGGLPLSKYDIRPLMRDR